MGELRTLTIVLIISALLGILAVAIFNSVPSSSTPEAEYSAVLYSDGRLVEVFRYHIYADREYTMLYRYWEAPLSMDPFPHPYIEFRNITCPPGSISYMKDYEGEVYTWPETFLYIENIRHKAYLNEAGCYFPQGIPAGAYTVKFEYLLHPPLQCDAANCHLNLMLAREHITYSIMNVTIINPEDAVKSIFVHVPDYEVREEGNKIVISGWAPQDQLLEIELVYEKDKGINIPGKVEEVSDALQMASDANSWYLFQYGGIKTLSFLLLGISALYPLILLIIYLWKGKEKKFTVPKYLSYVPDPKKKPWLVNLLFHGDALAIDQNALYATILDLEKRGILEITGDKENIIVRIKREPSLGEVDRYEKDVLDFLKHWGGEEFNIKELEGRVEEFDKIRKKSLYTHMNSLVTTPSWMKSLAKKYVTTIRPWFGLLGGLFIMLAFLVVFIWGSDEVFAPYNTKLAIPLFILGVQNFVAAAAPSQIFGRWKKDHYKEKLEWSAFRNMLKDFAMIQKYKPEDIVIWKEWLIYGTALGVGKEVVEAMEKLNIPVPSSGYFIYVWPRHYVGLMRAVSPKGSSSSGGGFGAGGGFGGGGGGVR